jgi:hypothetical protein
MESKGLKTRTLVSLFIAGVLAINSGCTKTTTTGATNECWDDNNDGYCDDDGSRAGSSYYMSNGRKRYTKTDSGLTSGTANKPSSGISSGTQGSKSGIGSSSSASSGSSSSSSGG